MELLFVSIIEASVFAFRDLERCWPAIIIVAFKVLVHVR